MSTGGEKLIGPWVCGEMLGKGGNASVYRARRVDATEEVALKVVKTTKAHAEPYRRFVREVQFLRDLGDFPGVLPLLDAHLPQSPTSKDRAWLAMPIATPIRAELTEASLEEVVRAVAAIAEALARLADEHQVGHRDIKPGNLYARAGEYLVGDFGLIDVPDIEELTPSGRPLGPANFTAYEVILSPATAASGPADAYSLAKTLWVLATGVNWPPNGHQPAESRGHSIVDHRPHPRAGHLDTLVDRATRLDAAERPTMRQVAEDLRAWLELTADPVALDVSRVRAAIRVKLADEIAAQDVQEERRELALAALRTLQTRTRPLNDALRAVHPRAETDGHDKLSQNTLGTRRSFPMTEIVWSWVRCSSIATGEISPYALRMGRCVELTGDGRLLAHWMLDVGSVKTSGNDMHEYGRDYEAPVGSVEQELMLERFVADLRDRLDVALAVFAEKAPTGGR